MSQETPEAKRKAQDGLPWSLQNEHSVIGTNFRLLASSAVKECTYAGVSHQIHGDLGW